MNIQTVIKLAIEVSIFMTVFSFGLKSSLDDVLYLVRRPSLFARSLLSMFIIMPVFTAAVVANLNLHPAVKIALVALAVSPIPPLLPQRELKAAGTASYGFGLLYTAALIAIIYVPIAVSLLANYFGIEDHTPAAEVARLVLITVLVPLSIGIAVRYYAPALAGRMAKPVLKAALVVLGVSILPLLVKLFPSVLSLIGDGTIVVIVAFVLVGLTVGHLLGGPEPDNRTILAFSTAIRHPGVALAIAVANFPGEKLIPAAIVMYLILNIIVSIPYLIWRRRRGT
jgi:BASS family bile acid:Na+ symporter